MEMRPGLNNFMNYVKKTLKELNSERKMRQLWILFEL